MQKLLNHSDCLNEFATQHNKFHNVNETNTCSYIQQGTNKMSQVQTFINLMSHITNIKYCFTMFTIFTCHFI